MSVYVHLLVLEAFLGPKPTPAHQAAHGNGDRADNRLVNLRWATCRSNNHDRWRHGTMPHGESHQNSKLTEQRVLDAKRRHRQGETLSSIARDFCLDVGTIHKAVRGLTWRHLISQ